MVGYNFSVNTHHQRIFVPSDTTELLHVHANRMISLVRRKKKKKRKKWMKKMIKCGGMLWRQRGLQNRVTCSHKIRGSRSHCVDLHDHSCILLGQNQNSIYHTEGPPIAQQYGAWSNKNGNVVMVKIWARNWTVLRLNLTTAGVMGLWCRLSYCGIWAATCFRLRGDNLNENLPLSIMHGDGQELEYQLMRCNWTLRYLILSWKVKLVWFQ